MSSRWALLQNGAVTALVVQTAAPDVLGTWVDVTGLGVGPGYTLSGETWTAPAAPVAVVAVTLAQLQAARAALGLSEAQIEDLFEAALPAT